MHYGVRDSKTYDVAWDGTVADLKQAIGDQNSELSPERIQLKREFDMRNILDTELVMNIFGDIIAEVIDVE